MFTLVENQSRHIANALNVSLFQDHSSYALNNAQRNLDGRTHWADDSALRFFACRIAKTSIVHDGAFLAVVYSQATGFDRKAREWNFQVFDLMGHTVDKALPVSLPRDVTSPRKSKAAAINDLWVFLEYFDAHAHCVQMVQDEIRHASRRLADLAALALTAKERIA